MSFRPVVLSFALALSAVAGCDAESGDEGFGDMELRGSHVGTAECVRSQGYWKTHNSYSTQRSRRIPWPIVEDTEGCGSTWYLWMKQTPARGDHWVILVHQWVGAMLNKYNGAPVPPEVKNALIDGLHLLKMCEIEDEDAAEATDLAKLLEKYNTGKLGVPHCE